MALREENLNIMLAELLTERGLRALGETILKKYGKRQEPDVLIVLNGVRIVIESKKLGMWGELVQQCVERLDNNVCDLCVMVEYTQIETGKLSPTQLDVKAALLKSKFNIGFLSYVDRASLDRWTGATGQPEQYKDIGFDDLLTYLMSTYTRVVRKDIIGPVVDRMNEILREFAGSLSNTINLERLKQVLELSEESEENRE